MQTKNINNKKLVMGLGVVVALAAVFGVGYWTANKLAADTTDFLLQVDPGTVSIDAPSAIDFGAVSTAATSQDVVKQTTTEKFYVYDMRGGTGYYTTLQSTSLQGVNASGNVVENVPATNIYIGTNSDNANLETGTAQDVTINSAMFSGGLGYLALDSAQTYIKRDAGTTQGLVGVYYDLPRFKLVLPAYISVGEFTSLLTYTLFEQ